LRTLLRRLAVALICVAIVSGVGVGSVMGLRFAVEQRFEALRADAEQNGTPISDGFDSFKHAYASAVLTRLFGRFVARLAGHVVEFVEMESCPEREHDLINNEAGRRMVQALPSLPGVSWRDSLADELFLRLALHDPEFSYGSLTDPRVRQRCGQNGQSG